MTLPHQKSSSIDSVLAPLRVEDPSLALQVRRGLLAMGYNGDAVRVTLENAREPGAAKADYAAMAKRLAPVNPLACLVRAFALGAATPEIELRSQLGAEFFDLCETAGLWDRVDGGVTGSVVIMVDGKTFLLSDRSDTRLGEVAMYWVMGIGVSTMKLGNSLARRPYDSVLDLCCGAGVQAYLASPHARRVVAVDRNQRALNYGQFGAQMNKFNNIEFKDSDCYSAVAGEQFDAILCNPPYVLTPDRQTYYRDGGMGGDRFAERVLRETPAYLREGAVAHIMCDVAAMEGKTSEERLRAWLAGNGCDVLAIGGRAFDAATYAKNWLAKDWSPAEEKRWVDSFHELGVASVTNMLVVLRKRDAGGANRFRLETIPADPRGHFGHQLARLIANDDLLESGDAAIANARLRVPADVRLTQAMRAESGKWLAEASRITFAEGLAQELAIDQPSAALLAGFDGTRKAADSKMRIGNVRHWLSCGVLEQVGK